MSESRPPFGPPPRAHAADMYRPAPVVRSRAQWIADIRAVPEASPRPRNASDVPPTKHRVDFGEMLRPTRRGRR